VFDRWFDSHSQLQYNELSDKGEVNDLKNGLVTGIILGIGVGIGIMATKEAKDAYDRYMFKRKIKNQWSNIKEVWNEVTEGTK